LAALLRSGVMVLILDERAEAALVNKGRLDLMSDEGATGVEGAEAAGGIIGVVGMTGVEGVTRAGCRSGDQNLIFRASSTGMRVR
jgi:hypothetical protein